MYLYNLTFGNDAATRGERCFVYMGFLSTVFTLLYSRHLERVSGFARDLLLVVGVCALIRMYLDYAQLSLMDRARVRHVPKVLGTLLALDTACEVAALFRDGTVTWAQLRADCSAFRLCSGTVSLLTSASGYFVTWPRKLLAALQWTGFFAAVVCTSVFVVCALLLAAALCAREYLIALAAEYVDDRAHRIARERVPCPHCQAKLRRKAKNNVAQ